MRRRQGPCCCVLLLASTLAAQTVPSLRGAAIGEVRDRDGKPWTAAEVVLLSRPLPADADHGEADRVVASVDARGRFHADVLRGRPYTAWAWAAPDGNGRRVSDVVELVFAQRPVVLTETRVLPHRHIAIAEAQRWPGALALRVVDHIGNRGVSWVDVRDDAAELPWLLGATACVEVFAGSPGARLPLVRARFGVDDAGGERRLELPQRMRVTCWARAVRSGKPCADAEVLRGGADALFAAGRTDASGTIDVDLPEVPPTNHDFRLFVRVDGSTLGFFTPVRPPAGWGQQKLDPPPRARDSDWFANLTAGASLSVRVLGTDRQPLVGAELWTAGMAIQHSGTSSTGYGPWCDSFTTDGCGEARIVGLAAGAPRNTHLLLREHDCRLLPPAWRSGLAPVVFAPLVGAAGKGSREDPLVVDLLHLCPLELQILQPNGDPAALAELDLAVLDPYVAAPWSSTRGALHADHVGRVRVLVPSGIHLGVRAVLGMSMGIRAIETQGGEADAGPATVTLRLPAPTGIRGRLLDQAGAPLVDHALFATLDGNNAAMAWTWASEPAAAPSVPPRNRARIVLPDAPHERQVLTNLITRFVTTPADGTFAVPLPSELQGDLRLFHGVADEHTFADSVRVHWTGEAQDEFVFNARF